MNHRLGIVLLLVIFVVNWAANAKVSDPKPESRPTEKEWTFLLFLNGHNNLDPYGAMNINQMEQIGSSDQVNLVVQWASLGSPGARIPTKRILVQRDDNLTVVTSPVVQELGVVDMGDWRKLTEFVEWGVQNYPAKKYFIAVWNHGNGWHLRRMSPFADPIHIEDISYDDISQNKITTEQLGLAMAEAARVTGKKIELYGSDACLMAMAEVASEMKDSVNYFAGSEEVEPGEGWPYNMFIRQWVANPTMDGAELGRILTNQYVAAYSGGIYGNREVTFSVMNLNRLGVLEEAVRGLTQQLLVLDRPALNRVRNQIAATQSFWNIDYRDLKHFALNLGNSVDRNVLDFARVRDAVGEVVVANEGTPNYVNSHGIAIWLPYYSTDWNQHGRRYRGLKFHQATGWGEFLGKLYGGLP